MFKNIMFQIASTLIAISVLAYLVLHTLSSFENELEIKNVYYTTMDLTYDSTAYFFRDESALISNKGGFVVYDVENGKKVSTNQKIASIYSDSSANEVQDQMTHIKKEIEYLETLLTEVKFTKPSVSLLDKNVSDRLTEIAVHSKNGNLKNALDAVEKSVYDIDLKYCLLNGTKMHEELLDSYKKELERLSSFSSKPTSFVSTPTSGYFYSETDGYEDIFSFEEIEKLSAESFEILKNASPDHSQAVGKIVENSRWYIAYELKTSDAITLAPNEKYSVYFPASDRSIQMKVEKRVDSSSDDKKIVVMSSNAIFDNFNFSRKQAISVTALTCSGLAFPSSAVHIDYDATGASKAGVYILDETVVKFKTFTKLMEKNGYILCSVPDSTNISAPDSNKVSLFDAVIVEGTNLYHGKVIKNVLKAK